MIGVRKVSNLMATIKQWCFENAPKMEIALFFLMTPHFLSMLAIPTFELEKACVVDLGLNVEFCENLNNPYYKDQCANVEAELSSKAMENFTLEETELTEAICSAEQEAQKVLSKLYAYRAPIATILMLVIALFAGTYSDKKDVRKLFILVPFIGEMVTFSCFLIAAVYMDTIPASFIVPAAKIIPAVTGGATLFMIGVSSYITIKTPEEKRTFRFGVFSIFMTVLGMSMSPLSSLTVRYLKYTELFSLCILIAASGSIFVIFCIEEVKATTEIKEKTSISEKNDIEKSQNMKKNAFMEFFDPNAIKQCIDVLKKKRDQHGRRILILIIACHTLYFTIQGEMELFILFSRKALHWTTEFGVFITFVTFIGLLGTIITTCIFVKLFKLSDSMLGIISLIGSILAHPLISISTTTTALYTAVVLDIFSQARHLSVKSMISKIADVNELGRVYSLLGVCDNLDLLLFSPIYYFIYYNTVDDYTGAIFLFSEIFLIPALVMFIILRYQLCRIKAKEESKKQQEDTNAASSQSTTTVVATEEGHIVKGGTSE